MKLVLESTTSTLEIRETYNINVYPNPTTGMVTLETDRYLEGTNSNLHPTVTITDQLGRVLKQQKWPFGQRFDIDISHLAEGVYFIRLHEGNQLIWTDRLVKVGGR